MNTIALIDKDCNDVAAIVNTNMNREEVNKIICEVKERMPGEWQVSDVIDAIGGTEIEVSYCCI